MGFVLIVLLNASIFSINGIGEDLGVFRTPFLELDRRASIEFTLQPEFNVLNEGGDFRSIFWTNPFEFTFTVPLTKRFIFSVGNYERYSQSFDVYLEEDELMIHLIGKGGIGEIYANLNNDFKIGKIAFRGSYLFGNPWEIWDYSIGDYYLTDTFFYKYRGRIFSGGLQINIVSVSYEFLGSIVMEKENFDTTITLPERLSIGVNPPLFGGAISLLYEHSFWRTGDNLNYISPNRFKIGFIKKRVAVNYFFNPWYLEDVTEHGVNFSLTTPIKNLGTVTLNICCSLRNKDSLREFKIIPGLKFTLNEIFGLRRY